MPPNTILLPQIIQLFEHNLTVKKTTERYYRIDGLLKYNNVLFKAGLIGESALLDVVPDESNIIKKHQRWTMEKVKIEEKEIFSLLTSKQIAQISEFAVVKDFEEGHIIYNPQETARDLYILLEGEVSLRVPSKKDLSFDNFSIEIEKITNHGQLFGTNLLFGLNKYMTRARVKKPSKIMIIHTERFLHIIRENRSEFAIMSYLAKVYFQRYIDTMKELEERIDAGRND